MSSFTISDGAFGTCFFFGTGFHGLEYNMLFFSIYNNYNISLFKKYKNFDPIIKRLYSITSKGSELSPYWVTGFSDAESSFSLKISYNSILKSRLKVIPEFRIELHTRDTLLLRKIQSFFGIGIISERIDRNTAVYSVQSVRDIINVIIPHFDKYSLITQKKADYLLFKQGIELLTLKRQSDPEGIHNILSIKASMNSGLSDTLKSKYPTLLPIPRPVVNFEGIPDGSWVAGFVDGEGCFYVNTKKARTVTGFQIIMTFSISQHVRDEILLTKLIDYFGCGGIEKVLTRNSVTFVVYKFSLIKDKIIPFFQSYPLHGIKSIDFQDFCKIANIMEDKSHLTQEGLKIIKSIKSGMNRGRIFN